jgi:hypothetical protein
MEKTTATSLRYHTHLTQHGGLDLRNGWKYWYFQSETGSGRSETVVYRETWQLKPAG